MSPEKDEADGEERGAESAPDRSDHDTSGRVSVEHVIGESSAALGGALRMGYLRLPLYAADVLASGVTGLPDMFVDGVDAGIHLMQLGSIHVGGFDSSPLAPTIELKRSDEREAAQRVADTVWIIWGEDAEAIWGLTTEWAMEGGLVGEAAGLILSGGIEEGRLDEADGLRRIEELLLDEEPARQEAGSRLLFAIPAEQVSEATRRWSESDDEKHIERLPRLLERLLQERLFPTLRLFRDWVRSSGQVLHSAIKEAIASFVIPADEPDAFYRNLIKELTGLKGRLGGGRRGRIADKLKEARDMLSVRRESAGRRKRIGRSSSADPLPGGKSRKPRRRKR